MKRISILQEIVCAGVAGSALALLASGCATGGTADWNHRVGNYTYDRAVADLGCPTRTNTITDGGLIAQWIKHRGGANAFARRYDNFYGTYPGYAPFSETSGERVLALKFGPDHKLVEWANLKR